MWYDLIDPLFFMLAFAMSLGAIFIQKSNSGNRDELKHVCGWIAGITFLFLIFNFKTSIDKSRHLSRARKTYNSMYENGSNHKRGDFNGAMFFFAFMSFLAALLLMILGVVVLILADNEQLTNNNGENRPLNDNEKLDGNEQTYFHILGVVTIICSIIGLLRLPLDYLLASLGVYWLLSIFLY